MEEKILVDKDFLFKVLNQVDSLTKRIIELELRITNSPSSISEQQFSEMYNKMVERNMKSWGINFPGIGPLPTNNP